MCAPGVLAYKFRFYWRPKHFLSSTKNTRIIFRPTRNKSKLKSYFNICEQASTIKTLLFQRHPWCVLSLSHSLSLMCVCLFVGGDPQAYNYEHQYSAVIFLLPTSNTLSQFTLFLYRTWTLMIRRERKWEENKPLRIKWFHRKIESHSSMRKLELANELEMRKKEIKSYLEISFQTQNQLTLTPTWESHSICTFSKITFHLSGKNLIKYYVENCNLEY